MIRKKNKIYEIMIDYIFVAILLIFTVLIFRSLISTPKISELRERSLLVKSIQCVDSKGYSSLLMKFEIDGEAVTKLLKAIKDCSEEKYGYIVGKTVEVLWSDKNKLSIWKLSSNENSLVSYEDTKSEVSKSSYLTLILIWGIFGIIATIRIFKRRKLSDFSQSY